MKCPDLLPTRARTAEKRRLELSKPRDVRRYGIKIRKILTYQEHPTIKDKFGEKEMLTTRFFPDGLEAIIGYGNEREKNGNFGYCALLIVEGRRQSIEFYYELPNRADEPNRASH
jgi:hypothetical protein